MTWIIKFLAGIDGPNCGLREYIYSECARKCGIKMTETRLFPSKICDGYFGTGAGIRKSLCADIIDEIRTIVGEELAFIKKDN